MDDITAAAIVATSAFFVVLSVVLLYRYRQVSTRIATSNDLGRDLWQALEARMKKQDERILDMMARVEVIHSRAVDKQAQALSLPPGTPPAESAEPADSGRGEVEAVKAESLPSKGESQDVTQEVMSQPTQPIQGPPSGASITDTATASILKEINTLETRLRVQDERLMDVIGRIESAQSRRSEVRQREPTAASPVIVERVSTGGGGRKVSESDLIAMLGEKPRTSVEIRVKFGISREHAARVLTGLFERNLVVRNDAHKPFVYELTEAGRKLLSSGS